MSVRLRPRTSPEREEIVAAMRDLLHAWLAASVIDVSVDASGERPIYTVTVVDPETEEREHDAVIAGACVAMLRASVFAGIDVVVDMKRSRHGAIA